MEYLTQEDLEILNKWYLKKGFIIFLACIWWLYFVPLFIAIHLQNKKDKILNKVRVLGKAIAFQSDVI